MNPFITTNEQAIEAYKKAINATKQRHDDQVRHVHARIAYKLNQKCGCEVCKETPKDFCTECMRSPCTTTPVEAEDIPF